MRLELDSSILERWLTILSTNEGAPVVQDEIEQLLGPAISFETSQKRFRLTNNSDKSATELQGMKRVIQFLSPDYEDSTITSLYRLAPGQQFTSGDWLVRRLK